MHMLTVCSRYSVRSTSSLKTMASLPHASKASGASTQSRGSARTLQPPKAVAAPAQPQTRRSLRPENVPGDFAVDHTCIDCDTCRWMAPSFYSRVGDMTAVHAQPSTPEERLEAYQALLACPTHSIHATSRHQGELRAAAQSLPKLVQGTQNVYHCAYHSEASYGAASYLVTRQEGNVLFDSPRFDPKLLRRIQELGGAKYMVLSHRDDVADHAQWAQALGAQRIIHRLEANRSQGTHSCEVQLDGSGPWELPDGGEDVSLVATPGHTNGHIVLHFRPEQTLLTGDHLSFRSTGLLGISRMYNWHSVPQQLDSVRKIQGLDFKHLLPGHGRPGSFKTAADKDALFQELLDRES